MIDPGLLKLLLTTLCFAAVGLTFLTLPGIILIFLSVLLYAWYTGFTEPSTTALVIAGIVTLASFWVDNLAMLLGAKKFGSSKWGILGAILGGLLGLIVGGFAGIIVGPLLGAIVAELIVNKELKSALKSGFGTFIGYLFGMFLKLIITIIMFVWALTVIW